MMNLTRYWSYESNNFKLDSTGYLIDPYEFRYNYNDNEIIKLDEIVCNDDVSCAILFGESGMGKTTELDKMNRSIDEEKFELFYYNFEINSDLDKLINELPSNPNIYSRKKNILILIDSIEESENRIYKVFKVLNNIYNDLGPKKIKLLISCRTSNWTSVYDQELREIRSKCEIRKYYLAPLTKKNTLDFIYNELNNELAESLIKKINEYKLESFARVPILLVLLLKITKDDNYFDITREGIYDRGCKLLCKELNEIRKNIKAENLNIIKMIEVAEWISYISILSDKKTIVEEEDFCINKENLYVSEHLANKQMPEADIINVLKTSLFIQIDKGKYRWAHMSYAEYLCARYMTNNLSEEAISQIIFHNVVSERLVPKLKDITAWIIQLKLNNNIICKIIENDCDTIFLSDLSQYSQNIKKKFILKVMENSVNYKYGNIEFLGKQVYRTCLFEGLEKWIQEKLKLFDLFYNNLGNKTVAEKTINEIYETNNVKYISEDTISVLIDLGNQCKFESILEYSLIVAASYYYIGEKAFNSYIQAASNEQVELVFKMLINKTLKKDLNIQEIRGKFILNLINQLRVRKEANIALDVLNDYYRIILKDDNSNKLEHILSNISYDELINWINKNILNKQNNMLIDKIVNIIFKYKVSNLSSEEIIELINFIFDENIYTKSIEYFNEWMKVEKNFNLLKENIGDDKLEKIYLKSDKFIVKDNNKTKKNLLEYDLSNETEFEYLFYICNNIANKGIDYWCSLVEELLKRNNYEIWEYNMLSQFIDPRLNALDAIDWNNLTNKATILYAAKKYFSSYKSNEKEKTLHVCKAEHEILISILLEEEPEFFKNIEESKLENWIMNIFKFEPINEYLLKVVYNKIPDEFIRVATINIDNDYMGCGLIEGNLSVFKYVWNEHISEILYSYLISNEINVYKKKGIFNFLYNMKDRKAIRYADKILNNVNCDDLKLKLFFLGTFFTKGRDDVFRMIQNWAETCIGFTAKFIKVLGDEEYNFNFLNQYSPEEISNLYINFNNEKDVYISDFISRFDGSSFENSISAEIDFDSKKESLLYYLVDNGSDKGGEALYNLKQLFPNDKMVLEKWHKESDKYLSNSWEYIDIRYLKDTVANDKLNIANSEKKYSYKNLLESVIYTCIKLQGTKIYTNRKVSENDRNSFIANLLEAQGYKIKDQTLWGDSSNGKQAGEVDILITEESGIPFSIIEALNLTGTNRSYLNKHLEKIFKYDANGLKFNFIVVYYLGTSFQDFWKNYLEDVSKPWSKFKNLGSPSIIESKYTNLRIGLTKHIRNNESTNLYHICVDMNVN